MLAIDVQLVTCNVFIMPVFYLQGNIKRKDHIPLLKFRRYSVASVSTIILILFCSSISCHVNRATSVADSKKMIRVRIYSGSAFTDTCSIIENANVSAQQSDLKYDSPKHYYYLYTNLEFVEVTVSSPGYESQTRRIKSVSPESDSENIAEFYLGKKGDLLIPAGEYLTPVILSHNAIGVFLIASELGIARQFLDSLDHDSLELQPVAPGYIGAKQMAIIHFKNDFENRSRLVLEKLKNSSLVIASGPTMNAMKKDMIVFTNSLYVMFERETSQEMKNEIVDLPEVTRKDFDVKNDARIYLSDNIGNEVFVIARKLFDNDAVVSLSIGTYKLQKEI